jgi:hypothetical protein
MSALRQKLPFAGSKSNFRLIPEIGLKSAIAACPKCANNGSAISVLLSHSERLVACEPVPHLERTSSPSVAYQGRMLLKSGWPRR